MPRLRRRTLRPKRMRPGTPLRSPKPVRKRLIKKYDFWWFFDKIRSSKSRLLIKISKFCSEKFNFRFRLTRSFSSNMRRSKLSVRRRTPRSRISKPRLTKKTHFERKHYRFCTEKLKIRSEFAQIFVFFSILGLLRRGQDQGVRGHHRQARKGPLRRQGRGTWF